MIGPMLRLEQHRAEGAAPPSHRSKTLRQAGLLRKLRHRGVARVNWIFVFTAAAYNLVRMRTLEARPA